MKHYRFFRILAIAVILSLVMIAIPVTPALAAASVTLSPETGKIGDKVSIGGEDFSYSLGIFIYFSSQQASIDDIIDVDVTAYQNVKRIVTYGSKDPNPGTFSSSINSFDVPAELTDGDDDEMVHGGTYYVYAADEKTNVILTVDKFTVIGIASITPAEGPVGTRVTIEGVAFEDEKDIAIEYDGVDVTIASGDSKTDSDGDFTCKIDVPASTAGVHTVTAIVEDIEGDTQFAVESTITLSPDSGGANDEVTVTGSGFGEDVLFDITFEGEAVATSGDDETDDDGSFGCTFTVPSDVEQDTYDIRVKDDDGNTAEAKFSVAANLILSAGATADSPGYVGMDLTVSGTNFKATWPITITYESEKLEFTDIISEDDGSFSYTFTVPASEASVHIITATDGDNTVPTRFFMETTPPEVPSLLKPLADGRLEEWKFDWEDVTTDADGADELSQPVTYDFQVATDADFTSPLVSQTALTTSAYILTEDEKLEETSEDEPYYWRVRATDAASNIGDWSDASAFYVGSNFTGIHGWLLYTLIAIGVLVAIVLGIWIGRKLSTREDYYY